MSCPVNVHPHHVGIFVSSLDRSVAWWEEMLGFEKKFENVFFLPDRSCLFSILTEHLSNFINHIPPAIILDMADIFRACRKEQGLGKGNK